MMMYLYPPVADLSAVKHGEATGQAFLLREIDITELNQNRNQYANPAQFTHLINLAEEHFTGLSPE